MKYAFVERHIHEWPITIQCSVLGVSVSGFQKYLHRKAASNTQTGGEGRVSDMALLAHIRAIHAETKGAYGWPRIWRELQHRNIKVGKERVRKMMQDNDIRARGKEEIQSHD